MNVSSKHASRWQKRRERGVSPIIATILLVAITVVLAAVLYVLVSGLTSHGASTPYSVDFTSAGGTGSGNAWYDPMGVTPTTGVTTSMFGLTISPAGGGSYALGAAAGTGCTLPASGAPKTWATGSAGCNGPGAAGWYGVLVASNNSIMALYSTSGSGWTYADGLTTISLTNSYTLYVVSYNQLSGQGYTINAFSTGTSSVSGSGSL
jgi:flagellin-like protein